MSTPAAVNNQSDRLVLVDDAVRVVSLVWRAGASRAPIRERRRDVLHAMLPILDADTWLWFHSSAKPGRLRPINHDFQVFKANMTLRQQIAWGRRAFNLNSFGVSPENVRLSQLCLSGERFSATMAELVGEEAWRNDRHSVSFQRSVGFIDYVSACEPLGQTGEVRHIVGVTFGRTLGKPFFTQRERLLVEVLVRGVDWLGNDQGQASPSLERDDLPARYESIMGLLSLSCTYVEIGKKCGLTEGTVKTYAHQIFKRLKCKGRKDYIRLFGGRYSE